MKERVNLALADIRFIQSQIQKILNRQKKPNQKEERGQSSRKDRKSSKDYHSNFSPTNKKNAMFYQDSSKNTSPRVKRKESSTKKLKTMDNSPRKIEEIAQKFVKTQPKIETKQVKPSPIVQKIEQKPIQRKQVNEQRSIMQMWKQKQKQTKKIEPQKAQKPEQSPQKSAMALWKQRQKQKNGGLKEQTILTLPKNKEFSPAKQSPIKTLQREKGIMKPQAIIQQIFRSQNLLIDEPVQVHPLLRKNTIPLRTDEDFLKKKYNYAYNKDKKQKQEALKEKYRLLDQRLLRLRYEIKTRDSNLFLSSEGHNQSKQAKVIKKHALAKYDRYSPLGKFVRVNERLKKDYERSLSNKQRYNEKKKVEVEQGRSKWLK